MKKKGLFTIAALLAIVAALSGCGGNGSNTNAQGGKTDSKSGEKVNITFWDENAGPNRTPFYEELIKRFEAKNPNIHVEYVGIPASTNKQKFDVAISANDMPDVGGIMAPWISDFVAKGALLPLDPYFDKWSDKDKIASTLISYNRSLAQDKKLYHMPTTMYTDVFWYRTDLQKAANLKPPTTWDDFFTNAAKLTDTAKNQYGYSVRGGAGSIVQLTSVMFAGTGIESYFNSSGKANVNDPKMIDFVKKYAALYKKNTPTSDVSNGYKEMVAAFDSGTAAMIQHNFGSYNDHVTAFKDKFAATLLPPGPAGKRVIVSVANGYGIFKSTKHPDEAWKFLSFLASSESQVYWNQNIGQMPTHLDALNSDYVKNAQHIQAGANALTDKSTVVLAVPEYLPGYANILKNELEPNFQKVLSGVMTVEDFLNGWAKSMEKEKADFDKNVKK